MPLKKEQYDVHKWASQFSPPYWPIHEQLARLSEEVGELAREINHIHGTKKKKPEERESSIGDELIDVIFTVCCIANTSDIDLEELWTKAMEKKHYGRDNQRYKRIDDNSP